MKLPQHSLSDCVTRCASTGKMIERIREQQEAINFVLGNNRKASHLVLNWQQKDVLEAIDMILSPLKMTDLLSGEDYLTILAIKPMLEHIFEELLKSWEGDTTLTKDLQGIIKNNLEAQYGCDSREINLIINLANFVDPRLKADL